jgi:hypothetical protein
MTDAQIMKKWNTCLLGANYLPRAAPDAPEVVTWLQFLGQCTTLIA